MSKLRVHDMASEFGISSDEVIALLRGMDVPVRSHLSLLSDDQVARIRARWEREKRVRAEKQAAPPPAAGARRRRSAAAEPEAPPAPVETAAAPVRRRRAAAAAPATTEETAGQDGAAVETPAAAEVTPPRPAEVETPPAPAEVAARPAPARQAPAQAPVEREVERPAAPVERAAAAPEAPAATPPAPPAQPAAASAATVAPLTPARPLNPPTPPGPRHDDRPRPASPSGPRPTPVVPGAPRPRPVASGNPFNSPRPVASAAPSGAGAPPRRDERGGGGGGGGQGGGGGRGGPMTMGGGGAQGGRRGKKGKRGAVDQEAVTANISKTMSSLRGGPARRRGRYDDSSAREEQAAERAAAAERERTTVRVNEFITVSELAQTLKISATEIVAFAFKNLGMMVTVNQRLDFDQIELIAGEFGFQAVREEEYQAESEAPVADAPEDLQARPPVVTIMGHVDHGKTSLLDYIRKANVVAGEAGGITQHIGAYHVTLPGNRNITFLDTPGHEAFTAMRARGAQVTDIVVLVVAADDGIMPQTVEAISHARNAGVPLIVAINKVDLAQANPARVKQELLQHNVVLEEFGGTVLAQEVSAKKGTGVMELLEQLALQSEILDLKANPERKATGTVVEAQLDAGKGPVATVLVQNGTLSVGDDFICGIFSGRVRALLDERGKQVKKAGPAIPVQILGLTGVPMAGDQLLVVEDATQAREIAQRRERLDREAKSRRTTKSVVSLEDFMSQTAAGELRTLKLLIKADQGGPAEALADALSQLSNAEVKVDVIQRGVGAISESDILLARASGAIIIGFHVRPDNKARSAAEREGVDIRLYRIIYEAVDDVRAALQGMLTPEQREVVLGEAEVRETFKVPKAGVIAGCSVRSGSIIRGNKVRVIRDGVEVYDGNIGSLRRFKEDVREVKEGYECGIGVENFNDLKVGDVIECYRNEEVARTLDQPNKSGT